MKIKKIILSLFISILSLSPATVFAIDYPTGLRTITRVGCHINSNICFANLAGDFVGVPSQCEATSVRWETTNPNGKEMLSMIMAAYVAGKKIDFMIDSCFGPQPTFPTFRYAITE
ncbi:MAG: hypothetical protein KDK66_02760 [Deltaproteobacteria bacterium]|nr:hypothetical protein [Deltaproteobacteria bacterium]